ncbi:hypothetical protein V8D89_009986 [Ganoderma adspersum]
MSPNITTPIQELSLDAGAASGTHWQLEVVTTPQPDGTQSKCRGYRRRSTNPTQVNSRPFPTAQEYRAAKKRCMHYGFYGGEDAIQKMTINCCPEELQGRKPYDPNLLLAAIEFIRNVTGRPDIGVHSAYVAQRNKDAIPFIGLEVGEQTFIISLFALEREAYMNRITQENVDMLEEFFGTKPSWWEIAQLTEL